jgi:tRNA A37 threonylcarbamoyladenosine dehydratase
MIGDDYDQRFAGLGRLFGRDALSALASAHVCVVGVGGVGSWTVEGLARSGVGALTLIDLDDVCLSNVNRQLPALDGQIGRPKITVLAERIRQINHQCRVTEFAEFLTPASVGRLLAPAFDCVVDAIDKVPHKALLIAECVKRGLACVTVGGAGGKSDPTAIRCGDLGDATGDMMLRLVRKTLRREYGFTAGKKIHFGVRCAYSQEIPVFPWADGTCRPEPEIGGNLRLDCASGYGTAVFVTGSFGLAVAGEAVRIIVGRPR